MAMFRVLVALSKGTTIIPAGSFTRLEWLRPAQQDVMVEAGAVSEVSAPPLEELPGWSVRAQKLALVGIVDVVQFLEADAEIVGKALRRKAETIESYRRELYRWLTADAPAAG